MAIKPKKVKIDRNSRNKYRIRKKIDGSAERPRISVFRSSKHIYAQAISDNDGRTLVSASTLEKEVVDQFDSIDKEGLHNDVKSTKGVLAAKTVGVILAKRCLEKDIKEAVFDRNGQKYIGRIKALADGARSVGLKI